MAPISGPEADRRSNQEVCRHRRFVMLFGRMVSMAIGNRIFFCTRLAVRPWEQSTGLAKG